jgi:hypothetical protein
MAEDRYLFGYFFTVLNKDSIMTQAIRDAAASLSRRSRSRSRLARWRIAFAPALLALAALSGLVQTATAQDKPLRSMATTSWWSSTRPTSLRCKRP